MHVKKRILIKGKKVHNVGYRPLLMEKAQELKILSFHAKNVKDKEDGKQVVDARVGGEGERIDKFLNFVNENLPEQAEVENISVEECEEDIMTLDEFSRVFSALQLSKIAQAGLGMIEMQKLTLGMQKQALGKHDQTLEKQDSMLDKQDETIAIIKSGNEMLAGKQDQMLGKQDETIAIIKSGNEMLAGKQDETIAIIKSGNEMLAGKQDQTLEKQDKTIGITKTGVNEMRESREENKTLLLDFHHDTMQRFDSLDVKYGKIAENIERILEELKEERKEYRESIEKLVNAIVESRKGDGGGDSND
jgi:acylphosphatase